MAIYSTENIVGGGSRTKRLAKDTPYIADGKDNWYVVAFFAPDPSTIFDHILDEEGDDMKSEMGVDVSMEGIPAPVEHSDRVIEKIQADKPIVLILSKNAKKQ